MIKLLDNKCISKKLFKYLIPDANKHRIGKARVLHTIHKEGGLFILFYHLNKLLGIRWNKVSKKLTW